MGRCPKPRSEPSFGEGSKNSQNFTAKGTRTVVCKRYVLRSGALCGEALEFLEPFPEGGSERGLGQCLRVFAFASLGWNLFGKRA